MKISVCAMGAAFLAMCLCISAAAHANVLIAGTRVVFPARDGEVTLRLTNDNTKPALVEAWIDRGNMHSTPDKVDTPFLITPPLFRMEAHKDQSLRIIYMHGQLPADRESLFWLNVLEVPPKPSGPQNTDMNFLQLAIRSRLKLFYRPADLQVDSTKAPTLLTFKTAADDKGIALVVHNPTPYYLTFADLAVDVAGTSYAADTGMVAPMADLRLSVPKLKQAPAAGTPIHFNTINDYGALAPLTATVTP
ncbi:MAG: molecular chaperone [Rhodanobacter sp.]